MRNDDDRRLQAILQAEALRLGSAANRPTAETVLWRAKVRAARRRQGRAAWSIAVVEAFAVGGLVLVTLTLSWKTSLERPVVEHAFTLTLFGAVVIATLGVLVAVALVGRTPNVSST